MGAFRDCVHRKELEAFLLYTEDLVEEYADDVENDASSEEESDQWIARELVANHTWSDTGAQELVRVARRYGSYFLRHALALAIARDQEDGDVGF